LGRLFEAFALIKDRPGFEKVGLAVVGSKGWKYNDALAKVGSLGLEDRVKLLGYVSDKDLPAIYAGSEFYVCPSVSEGFGMPLVEAMAAGTPVLSSSGGALPEVGGDAVRYFDPLNVKGMAETMDEALRDSEGREGWIRKGLEQAGTFRWERTAKLTIRAIEKCL
jgi:glycosyltransferase involved in cell wall biosynthesis